MARKSASQAKIKKPEFKQQELPPIEETFENAKQAFINTLEVSVQLAERVDNLLNIRDYVRKFFPDELPYPWKGVSDARLKYCKALMSLSIQTYKDMLEIVKTFELEEFAKEDMKDYFEGLMPVVEGITDEDELCTAGLVFLTIKPFGEKMTALHHTILDEIAQRKAMEE